ncbi:MAG: peptidase vanX D-ala-D-ala dipeptidase [Patescibacteria group bacterium]|nr:peptidase vanX D-ala-D-ala dipeptidase [Patescibacteria group bacterium]
MRKQIQKTLPKSAWDSVGINETNEELVEIFPTEKIILMPIELFPGITTSFMVRKSVFGKIHQAAALLPEGIALVVIEGYRSMSKQKMCWERKWNIVKSEHPDWNDDKIDIEVRQVVARPVGISNHVCGGAVDVMLAKTNGELLDFGTQYAAATEAERPKAPMFAKGLTDVQIKNRTLLREAMESVGFVWYPGEWWHYCYGDRMWAVYSWRKESFYGPIEM